MTKLILFPYAGSLGLGYNQWIKHLKTRFVVHRINYTELKEGFRDYQCRDWEELTELLFQKIAELIQDGDYIFFGHSMGSRAEYEMYRKIVEHHMPLPKQMIFSGCEMLTKGTKDPTDQQEDEFRQEYINLGGISDEVLGCKELADLAFADLKKDVKLLSGFQFQPVCVECPVTVLNGDKDKYSTKEEWELTLGCKVDWKIYSGKHFFIYDHQAAMIEGLLSLAE